MAEVRLQRLTRCQAEQQRQAVAHVYVTAYRGAAGAELRDRTGFLRPGSSSTCSRTAST